MKNNWIIGLAVAVFLAVLAILFALQNSELTAISFLTWDLILPLALIIILSFVIGSITALLLTIPGTYRRKREIRGLKKEKQKLLDQLNDIEFQSTQQSQETRIDSNSASET